MQSVEEESNDGIGSIKKTQRQQQQFKETIFFIHDTFPSCRQQTIDSNNALQADGV